MREREKGKERKIINKPHLRYYKTRRRAVGVGNNESLAARHAPLLLDEPDVIRIDRGHDQRDVGVHAVVLGVAFR